MDDQSDNHTARSQTSAAQQPPSPQRRRAIKIGAGAAAGAAIWSEPTIRGLARRPAFAQACSSPAAITEIQAEDTQLAGVQVDTNHAGFNGSGFVNFLNGTPGSATLNNVDGGCGGAATIMIRYALGVGTARSGDLIVNGVPQTVTFTPTGSWAMWEVLTVPIALLAGPTNTISLASSTDLGNTDEFTVISNGI